MLDGRVKTLHPKIHGGLLADLGNETHRRDLDLHGILPFELVVSNLYPFEAAARHRDHRHRRSRDDAGGGQEPRVGHDRHESRPVRHRCSPSCTRTTAPSATRRAARSRSTRSPAPPRTTPRSCSGCRTTSCCPSTSSSRSNAPTRQLRYGENPHQQGARYRRAGHDELVGRHRTARAASRCRTSTSTTPTRRGSSCTTSATGRRAPSSSTRTRAASRSTTRSTPRTNARSSATSGPRSAGSSR